MKVIVIGASAGGWDAINILCEKLPGNLQAAVLIVWHISPESQNYLPQMLTKKAKMRVESAVNNRKISEGHIYTAPPDNHLIIEDGSMRVVYGPKENRFRPAIDPLFRSAAYSYGHDAVGVLLSGMLSDGTAGLWSIKDMGGVTMVQDPDEAEFPGMPLNALKNVDIDYKISLSEMVPLLVKLTSEKIDKQDNYEKPDKMGIEIKMISDQRVNDIDVKKIGELSEFTCPECHGSLWKIEEGSIIRFRCRTGHAYSTQALLEELSLTIEDHIWMSIRGLEENTSLIKYLTAHLHNQEDKEHMDIYIKRAEQTQKYANILRKLLIENQSKAG